MHNCKRCDKLLDDETELCPACGMTRSRKRRVWGNFLTPSSSKPDVLPNDTAIPSFHPGTQTSRRSLPPPGYGQPPQFRPAQPQDSDTTKKAISMTMAVLALFAVALIVVLQAISKADQGSYEYDWTYEDSVTTAIYTKEDDYKDSCLPVSSSELMGWPEYYQGIPIRVECMVVQGALYFFGEEFQGEPVESDMRFFELGEYDELIGDYRIVMAATLPFDATPYLFYGEEAIFYGEYVGQYETEAGELIPLIEARLCQRADTLTE